MSVHQQVDEDDGSENGMDFRVHDNIKIYCSESAYVLVPVRKNVEYMERCLVVDRSQRCVRVGGAGGEGQRERERARDVLLSKGVLGIVQLEWDCYLVALTTCTRVGSLPQVCALLLCFNRPASLCLVYFVCWGPVLDRRACCAF
jgi:hypothetical protein